MSSSSAEASPASPSVERDFADFPKMSGGYGPRLCGAFADYDHDSCSWKTRQGSLMPEWAAYSEIWPRSGMTRNGTAYRRSPSVPITSVIGCSSLPTPQARDWKDGRGFLKRHGQHSPSLPVALGYQPHIHDLEMMMGFPSKWTDVEPSGTP
jgi:hypothetical protein